MFICTKGCGHTEEGDAYIARWKDRNGATKTKAVPRPEIISKYFKQSNVIDVHNQSQQFDLKLEKHWLTHFGFFRIITTVFGMCVTNCWHAYRFHNNFRHSHHKIGIVHFASIL